MKKSLFILILAVGMAPATYAAKSKNPKGKVAEETITSDMKNYFYDYKNNSPYKFWGTVGAIALYIANSADLLIEGQMNEDKKIAIRNIRRAYAGLPINWAECVEYLRDEWGGRVDPKTGKITKAANKRFMIQVLIELGAPLSVITAVGGKLLIKAVSGLFSRGEPKIGEPTDVKNTTAETIEKLKAENNKMEAKKNKLEAKQKKLKAKQNKLEAKQKKKKKKKNEKKKKNGGKK